MASSATMSVTPLNSQPLTSVVEWDGQSVQLKDFASRHSVPNVVRVTKGQYRNIGVTKSLNGSLYVHSVQGVRCVVAECIKVRDGKRAVATSNQKYAVPLSYQGWFEVLSEDGKAIKPIPSVHDLHRIFPHSCLVRDNIKAYITKDNGQLTLDRVRTVHVGEVLRLDCDVALAVSSNRGLVQRRLLRCIDSAGEAVFFTFEQKGAFSPIAGHANISGVHNLRKLLEKFRLPICVRLVHGSVPGKLQRHFTKVFRLLSAYSNQTAFVCPLKRDAKMVPISTRESIKIVGATNFGQLKETDECQAYHQRCGKMIDNYLNSIHMLVNNPEPEMVGRGKIDVKRKNEEPNQVTASVSPSGQVTLPKVEEDILFEEIDDIYQYVRDGGAVPAPRTRSQSLVVPSNVAIVPMTATNAVHVVQDMRVFEPETTDYADGVGRTTRISPPPTAKWDEPKNYTLFEKQLSDPTSPNDTFWEDPIYEPIDNVCVNKGDFACSMPDLCEPPDLIAGLTESSNVKLALRNEQPVVNLRQVIKRTSSHPDSPPVTLTHFFSDSEKASDSTGTTYDDLSAPPVPPKCFDDLQAMEADSDARPDVMPSYGYGSTHDIYDSRLSMAVNISSPYSEPPHRPPFVQNQAQYPAPVIASYNMAGGKAPTQIVFNSPHVPLSPGSSAYISVTSPPVAPAGPKYVAVAQVGDSPPAHRRPTSTRVSPRNIPLQHSNGNRHKLHTMVL